MGSRCRITDGVGRRKAWKRGLVGSVLSLPLLLACAGPQVIPQEYQDEVDRDLTFLQVKENPTAFQGRLLVIGGMVLSAKVMKAGTLIEVLQLPLKATLEPTIALTRSQGRFLAREKQFRDPATVPAGTRITIVGKVTGASTVPLGEVEYPYPVLAVKSLTVWRGLIPPYGPRASPYAGAHGGPYWGLYWGPWPAVPEREGPNEN